MTELPELVPPAVRRCGGAAVRRCGGARRELRGGGDHAANSPPLGVLSDFTAYLWCEIIIGLTLVTILAIQARRKIVAAKHAADAV